MALTKRKENKSSPPNVKKRNDLSVSVASYAREIDSLQKAYAELHEQFQGLKKRLSCSSQTLELMIHHMSEGLLLISQEGVITHVNPAAAALLNSSAEELLNTPFSSHFSDTVLGFSLQQALAGEQIHHRILLTLNETREVEVSTAGVPAVGLLILLRDRSELQQLERSATQSDRLKELGQMAATLAHEIRNPLGGIEGFARLLLQDLSSPSHQRMLEAILEGSHTLNHLVTTVLEYARPLHLHFATTDVVSLIHEVIELMKASSQNLSCHFSSPYSSYPLSLDRGQIKLVLLNLLRNAFEAGGSTVSLELQKEGHLLITDNGSGMAPQHLAQIFTPFFTTKTTGTGLGLAQAQVVIEAHGGRLLVSSVEGVGTTFTIAWGDKKDGN